MSMSMSIIDVDVVFFIYTSLTKEKINTNNEKGSKTGQPT